MLPLITVVIPVYKVEKYLARCIESVLSQTYTQLEIILVDDGSPDRCPEICDEYAAKDGRIKVIHKENGGVSAARNAAIEEAAGEYILFVDSDDQINVSMVSQLYGALAENDADIAACGFDYILENDRPDNLTEKKAAKTEVVTGIEAIKKTLLSEILPAINVFNKLYKSSLFEGVRFPVGIRNEDTFFTCGIMPKAKRVVLVYADLYYYLQNPHGFMHSDTNAYKNAIKAVDGLDDIFRANISDGKTLHELLALKNALKADYILNAYYIAYKKKNKEEAKKYEMLYRELSAVLSENGLKKLKFRLFDISPALFRLAFRVYIFKNKKSMSHFR